MILKTNSKLRVERQDGKMIFDVPGNPKVVLTEGDATFLLSAFSKPADPEVVSASIEDSKRAHKAIDKLIHCGALIDANALRPLPYDFRFDRKFMEIQSAVSMFTMGTPAINYALYKAVEYLVRARIPGALVESGVWKGGSAMICALTLKALGETIRPIVMLDTYEWIWPGTSEKDGYLDGRRHIRETNQGGGPVGPGTEMSDEQSTAEGVALESVKKNVVSTGYPENKLIFVKGFVEETIPQAAPERIALLRLDTDLYKSTLHELTHLYPRLSPGGILLVDDYPTQEGATAAVDEYFSKEGRHIFLSRLGIQGRIGVKPYLPA